MSALGGEVEGCYLARGDGMRIKLVYIDQVAVAHALTCGNCETRIIVKGAADAAHQSRSARAAETPAAMVQVTLSPARACKLHYTC